MLVLFIALGLIELLLALGAGWKYRRALAIGLIPSLTFVSLALIGVSPNLFTVITGAVSIFRLINLLRIIENRLHGDYLRHVFRQTSYSLVMVQFFVLALWQTYQILGLNLSSRHLLFLVALLQLLAAAIISFVTFRNIQETKPRRQLVFYSDQELPTVSVAIPARNETANLTHCIDSVLATDYPKLEVLVLDDCSQDETSDVIRAYAQSGVRFLHGKEPQTKWLAKNQAYQQLAEAASGEFILFCGVDTQLAPHTIRSLVSMALERKKSMVSVLPKRSALRFSASLIQPLRYWWELALPRKLVNRPPVLSSCWLIKRTELLKYGGFAAVSRSVIPESYFAKRFIMNNGYSFVRTAPDIPVTSIKGFTDQFERAIRVRYPEVHRRLELVWLLNMLEIVFLLGPFILLVYALVYGSPAFNLIIFVSCILLFAAHGSIAAVSTTKLSVAAVFNFPLAVFVELYVANLSMLRYEFSEVAWKERNICIPVMGVEAQMRRRAKSDRKRIRAASSE